MPIKAQASKRQVLRFQGLPFWDQKRSELEIAYQESFASDADAEEFTRDWIKAGHDCPVPADVWIAAVRLIARKREEESRTGFKCEICKDLRFIPASTEGVGFSRRCVCNPDTDESSLRYHYVKPKELAPHPEAALGIPNRVITAKLHAKKRAAVDCWYSGPLTIAEVVALGTVTSENAIGMVKYWMQEGGDVPTGNALIGTL